MGTPATQQKIPTLEFYRTARVPGLPKDSGRYTARGIVVPLCESPYIGGTRGVGGNKYLYTRGKDGSVLRVFGKILREGDFEHGKLEKGVFTILGHNEVPFADKQKGERALIYDFEDKGVWFVDAPGAYVGGKGEDNYVVFKPLTAVEREAMKPLVEQALVEMEERRSMGSNIIV